MKAFAGLLLSAGLLAGCDRPTPKPSEDIIPPVSQVQTVKQDFEQTSEPETKPEEEVSKPEKDQEQQKTLENKEDEIVTVTCYSGSSIIFKATVPYKQYNPYNSNGEVNVIKNNKPYRIVNAPCVIENDS